MALASHLISLPDPDTNLEQNAPRPQGRSLIACQRMVDRLKTAYKDDIDALKAGNYFPDAGDGAPKTPKTPKTPRTVKRKVKDVDGETGAEETPKKRGRKKKVSEETVQTEDDANEAGDVKAEEE